MATKTARRFHYHTCCVNARAADIDAMVEAATRVKYDAVYRNCAGLLDWAKHMGYGRDGFGLHLKDDYAVQFYKSMFRGKRCYFIDHSSIEYIWTEC